jgi:hypothetical protein
MSMMAGFRQVTPALLERLRGESALVAEVIRGHAGAELSALTDVEAFVSSMPDELKATIEAMTPEMRAAWTARVEETLACLPALRREFAAAAPASGGAKNDQAGPEGLGPELDIEKAWHGVHWLLCGIPLEAPPPLGDAVLGGEEVGEDVGYGPARVLDPARVAAVATALRAMSADELAGRFDAVRLDADGVYPAGWSEHGRREWLREEYSRLRTFYLEAAGEGSAVLLWLL